MKVCVGGPFAAGKTTLFRALKGSTIFDAHIDDQPRYFQEVFPKVDWRHLATRHFNYLNQCLKEAELEGAGTQNILCDGGIFECLGHTAALTNFDHESSLDQYHAKQYDLVLLCNHLEVPIEDDGLRHTSAKLREAVADEIKAALNRYNVRHLLISGDHRERYKRAVEAISSIR